MLALTTDSLKGYGLNRIFKMVKEAQYDGLDLTIDTKNFDTQNTDYVRSLIDQYQLPVLALAAPVHCTPKKIQGLVDMAKKLGARIIVIQPPKIFDFKYIQWLKNEIPKIRQRENISIALENAPSSTFFGIIPEHAMGNILDLKKFKHACIDTTRIAQKREDLIRVYKTLKKFLVHVHLSNTKAGTPYYLPAKGILPVESLLSKLKQDGFPGTISLKVNAKFLEAGDDEKVMKLLAEQKLFYDTYFTNVKVMPQTTAPEEGE
ncbi:MAG TPA: TIM barrel protein [Candidatus Gracilibacteria bacterium]|nr:TIM barrel protein [Candidatus Gracilibacteria bacterium]